MTSYTDTYRPTLSPAAVLKPIALVLLGVLIGLAVSNGPERTVGDTPTAAAPAVEDWHGNVMRSDWNR